MNLLSLKYFIVTAELENMTRAAEKLFVSQSTLSRMISKLENELGVPLFIRSGQRIYLSEFGRRYYERAKRIFREIEDGRREAADLLGTADHQISLAVSDGQPYITATLIESYLVENPKAIINQHICSEAGIRRMLEQGTIDMAFVDSLGKYPAGSIPPVRTEHLYVIIPKNHPLALKKSLTFSDTENYAVVTYSSNTGFWDIVNKLAAMEKCRPRVTLEVDSVRSAMRLSMMGQGITYASDFILETELMLSKHNIRDDNVTLLEFASAILIDSPSCHWDINLITPDRRYRSKAANDFLNFAQRYFRTVNSDGLIKVYFGNMRSNA